MKLRSVALALALTFGLTVAAEARQKPAVHRVTSRKAKARTAKRVKSRHATAKTRARHKG